MTKRVALAVAILTSFHVPAAVAAEWPPPPPGMAYETDLKPHSLVVTNVVLDGVAKTADLDGKRDKTDLKVYGEVADKTKPYLADDLFPVVIGDETLTRVTIQSNWDDVMPSESRHNILTSSEIIAFDWDGVFYNSTLPVYYNGHEGVPGEWPRLSFPTSIKPTGDQLATTSTVAQVARQVVNTVWDSELGVAWEARMHNGQLYYVAVTNQPPEVK